MDRYDAMRVFRTVVDAGTFSAAARDLRMPLATVSRKVSELESHLGVRLMHRSTRKLVLTDAGADYLGACKRILEDIEDAERSVLGEYSAPRGHLVVTAPIMFGRLHVLPVAVEFLRAYPDVDLRIALGDRVLDLLDEHVDLALRIGRLPNSDLIASHLGDTRPVVSASPAYLAARGRPSQPSDLAHHDIVTFDGLTRADAWHFRQDGADTVVALHSRLAVNTADAAIDAAIAGAGLTRTLSYQVERHLREGTLERVLGTFEQASWPIHLVYPRQGRLPLKVRAFLDFAAPRLRARISA